MPVEVRIPAVLRNQVEGQRALTADAGSLRAVIDGLSSRYPALGEHVLGEDGDLHRFVNIYINDEDVRYLDGLDTAVSDGDVVAILPAVAGGTA